MKIKMPNGVILESSNEELNEQRLKYGGKEVKSNKDASKGSKSSENKEA